jgi:antitoxin (DNA-binding transcriptional repressor) of toxin-antitoxin stability system
MQTVTATDLKQRLGEVLDLASVKELAIERHGRVVAYLVPAQAAARRKREGPARVARGEGLTRAREGQLLHLVAAGDLRPSRWRRAGDARFMAGFAAFLASVEEGDRGRLFALAERLFAGSSSPAAVREWLHESGVDPARLLPMLAARRSEALSASRE